MPDKHSDTGGFQRLLEVCRPCTDEPRLLSSIASLVRIRTILIDLIYPKQKYELLQNFLDSFQVVELDEKGSDLENIKNIQQSFEGLIEVFEKQTRSPGIKSCYEVLELFQPKCQVIFRAGRDESRTLMLESSQSLAEIALDCGLSDQSHLNRIFRRYSGMSPNAWRRSMARG